MWVPAANGAAFGMLPIGWIVLAAIFLYTLTVETGQFEIVKHSVLSLSDDRRIQALLIAFCACQGTLGLPVDFIHQWLGRLPASLLYVKDLRDLAASWGEWLDRLGALATRALRRPERVLSLLSSSAG